MYLGKVEISTTWTKLEDLIKAQVTGQSSFAFASGTTYQIQGEGMYGLRLCEYTSAPTDNYDGHLIHDTQSAIYEKGASGDLYVRTESGMPSKAWLKISSIGA